MEYILEPVEQVLRVLTRFCKGSVRARTALKEQWECFREFSKGLPAENPEGFFALYEHITWGNSGPHLIRFLK